MKNSDIAKKLRSIGEPEMASTVETNAMVVGFIKRDIKETKQAIECDKPCANCEDGFCSNLELIQFMIDAGFEL